MKKQLINNIIIFLGLFMLTLFTYFRFIRERLPKDIPFELTILGFFILIEICCIYIYIIFVTIKPPKKPNEIITIIINWLYTPLIKLDNWLKELPLIKKNYPKLIDHIIIICKKKHLYKIFEIILFIIPRIILIFTFILDIFYFGKLYYIYKVLYFGFLLLLRRYILYSIKLFKLNLILELKKDIDSIVCKYEYGVHPSEWEENYDEDNEDDIPETMFLPLDIFVNYYCENKIYKNKEISYRFFCMTSSFYSKYNTVLIIEESMIKSQDDTQIDEKIEENKILLNLLLKIALIEENYNYYISKNNWLKLIKIMIYSLYLFCWSYILFRNIHTLNIIELLNWLNHTLLKNQNPFSG